MTRLLRPLVAKNTWRRWSYLILGGALMIPYSIEAVFVTSATGTAHWLWQVLVFAVTFVGPMFVTGLVPAVRVIEGTAARELLDAPEVIGQGKSWPDRLRVASWYTAHLLVGGVVGLFSVLVPAGLVWSVIFPFIENDSRSGLARLGTLDALVPVLGLLGLVTFVYAIAGLGVLVVRLAPWALGPSKADLLLEAEKRADTLAERNRLARELHDSVGHALSIVTVQAGAAARVLETDPAFARQALNAITDSARTALEDLDHVLGLLRDEAQGKTPQRTLSDLDDLLLKTGLSVNAKVSADLDRVPAAVSREAYRIVQEGLTNVLRHAGEVPVTLVLEVSQGRLDLDMSNPLSHAAAGREGGGRGLQGIRERVVVLRGEMSAQARGADWHVRVSIPITAGSDRGTA
ncbi:MAG: histidine kinase [Streptosporangiaceae bacterium]